MLWASALAAHAQTVSISFESLSDGTLVDSAFQSQGVIFSNAVVATAGLSLNQLQFPPLPGNSNVVFDAAPITLTFSQAVTSVSADFTYVDPLTLTGQTASGTMVATASSQFGANYLAETTPGSGVFVDVTPGASANELIQLSSSAGFTQVTISGSPDGGSFALDNLDFTFAKSVTTAPEINADAGRLALALLAGLGLLYSERARMRQRRA
jgi:hypothetical protein